MSSISITKHEIYEHDNWDYIGDGDDLFRGINNLNHVFFRPDFGDCEVEWLSDQSVVSEGVRCEVNFRNLKKKLCKYISQAEYVFGCIAWLTNKDILIELGKLKGACIIVQKEDFLRPDMDSHNGWQNELKELYSRIRCTDRYSHPGPLRGMSTSSETTLGAVRCCGNYNSERKPAMPRMHNKFLCFCVKDRRTDKHDPESYIPYAAWTGSYNLTNNAESSFENGVYIRDHKIASAFYNEFAQIAALSEPLNWKTEWMSPQWRLGT